MSLTDKPVTLSEEILTGEDKDILRRQLELLKREYDRTAQRLQRAERKEAVRKHVQKRISDQNRSLQNDTSITHEPSSACSSDSDLLSNQILETTKKAPLVRFQLPEEPKTSSWGTPTCRRCPTQRLRSKRSRLRLQSREMESDTDNSQEKDKEGEGAGQGEEEKENGEKNLEGEGSVQGELQEIVRTEGRIQTVEEKNQNGWREKQSDGEDDEERQGKMLNDRKRESDSLPTGLQKSLCSENPCQNFLSPVGSSLKGLLGVEGSSGEQSGDRESQSSSSASDQVLMLKQSYQSAASSDHSEEDMTGTFTGADKSCEEMNGVPSPSGKAAFLDSCTVIEGLPFPVEYYVRTTRRMAASHSSVDLDAVIHSQLTRGRGRRRSGLSQTRNSGRVLLESSEPGSGPQDRSRGRGRGPRGRRGRGQKRVRSMTTHSPAVSGIAGHSQVEPSPKNLSESESSFQMDPLSMVESVPLFEALSPDPTLNKEPVTGFRHLLDTQLYLDCQLLPDSEVYPIFRKRRGQAGGTMSQSGCQTNDLRPLLPSLASLVQTLRMKDVRNLGQLLTIFDIQDFHLPDDEFGKLKLERLCSNVSISNVEPFIPHSSKHHSGRRCSLRIRGNNGISSVLGGESEEYTTEQLPPSTSLDCSFPLSQLSSSDQSQMKTDQSDVHFESSNPSQPKFENTDQLEKHSETDIQSDNDNHTQTVISKSGQIEDQADEDQMTKCQLQTSLGLVELQPSHNKLVSVGPQDDSRKSDAFLQNALKMNTENGVCTDSGEVCSALPAVLNLSLSSTSLTQRAPDPFLPSLGMTPHHVSLSSPSCLNPILSSPSDQGFVPCTSQTLEHRSSNLIPVTTLTNEVTDCQTLSSPQASIRMLSRTEARCKIRAEDSVLSGPESGEPVKWGISENETSVRADFRAEDPAQNTLSPQHSPCVNIDHVGTTSSLSGASTNLRVDKEADSASRKTDQTLAPSNQHFSTTEPAQKDLQSPGAQDCPAKTSQPSDEVSFNGVLQKIHTLKALDGGCVLDACVLRLASEDLVVCVAAEWSVYVWARRERAQEWSLLHTWTFTQSIISLQAVLDSAGLLCVSLGSLEITEVRTLYCPTAAGEFLQVEVCVGALQAVVGVCERRLVCCSVPGAGQNVTVFTLSQEGRVASSVLLASTERSIRTLAAVEGQRNALIGWTECQCLLIWNTKSGQLLQSFRLTETVSTSSCLRGYSYKGALCVLLQSDGEDETAVFALIAANPLTGKHVILSSISSPAPHAGRLVDGDACGSSFVGVFESGRLALWDMRGGGATLWGGGATAAGSCHLVRWAGPNMLITGHTNGDIGLFQYRATNIIKMT